MMTDKQIIEVIKAHKEGKEIEVFVEGSWLSIRKPEWNFHTFNYRIKPSPTPRLITQDELLKGKIRWVKWPKQDIYYDATWLTPQGISIITSTSVGLYNYTYDVLANLGCSWFDDNMTQHSFYHIEQTY